MLNLTQKDDKAVGVILRTFLAMLYTCFFKLIQIIDKLNSFIVKITWSSKIPIILFSILLFINKITFELIFYLSSYFLLCQVFLLTFYLACYLHDQDSSKTDRIITQKSRSLKCLITKKYLKWVIYIHKLR